MVSALTIQESCGQTAEGPKRGHEDYQKGAECALEEEVTELAPFSLGKRRVRGTSSQYFST